MKLRILLACCVTLALTVGVATATGGNSPNAKLCQKNGWKTLFRSDGSSFANQDECVSYAAKGATLTTKTKSQVDCEAMGGTFSTDPSTNTIVGGDGLVVVWTCNEIPFANLNSSLLRSDCAADRGAATGDWIAGTTGTDPWRSTCYTQ